MSMQAPDREAVKTLLIELGVPGIYGWRRFWKRAFDLVLAVLGLVLISPLLLGGGIGGAGARPVARILGVAGFGHGGLRKRNIT